MVHLREPRPVAEEVLDDLCLLPSHKATEAKAEAQHKCSTNIHRCAGAPPPVG